MVGGQLTWPLELSTNENVSRVPPFHKLEELFDNEHVHESGVCK